MEEEIELYVERSIVDIARKCNVYNTEVLKVMKKLLKKYENQFY